MAQTIRDHIESLGPYPSLFLLVVPTAVVEPLKLVAAAVAGEGHWITGTVMIIAAYAIGLLVLERLFVIVKPKLMTLGWFAGLWLWLVRSRPTKRLVVAKRTICRWITESPAPPPP